jgi:copper transport protein
VPREGLRSLSDMQIAPCQRMTRSRRASRATAVVVWAFAVALASMLLGAAPASAHTGFDSSTPADQSTVEAPVELVTISFTGAATPVGEGFVALNASGVLQEPVSVSTLDDQVFTIRFDPPLAGGQVGIRWNVQAADTHPIEGAFSFTVTAPLPTTVPETTVPETTVPAATTPVTTTAGSQVGSTAAPTSSVAAPSVTEPSDEDATGVVGVDGIDVGGGSAAPAQTLDEFLAIDDTRPGDATALAGRILGLVGVALALGAVAFGISALRGRRAEVRTFLAATAGVSGVLVVGAVVEYLGVVRLCDESIGSAWSTSPGFATVLRVVGGLALIVGLLVTMRRDEVATVRTPRGLSAAVVDDLAPLDQRAESEEQVRWTPTRNAWPIGVGVVVVLVSFWFDGHTVSKGFRPLHAAVNTVHVAAGSVWVGGVVSLCAIAWLRHRRGSRAGVAEMVVRFSRVATAALGAVVLAGVVMAFIVLDSLGDLTGTEWGQTLLLKTAAVAVAAAIGAYNHFRLLPALDAEPGSELLASRVRSTVTAEAIVLVFVVIVTASLVAAATT